MVLTADPTQAGTSKKQFDVDRVRADFPILARTVHGKPLVYLDNAASTQKPERVIEAISHHYRAENANVHRGVHYLSELATAAYERAREKGRQFLGAAEAREVIFVRGTTDAINLVAHAYVRPRLEPGDQVLVSSMEHHSNIVPWQLVCEERGATVRAVPMSESGELNVDAYGEMLTPKTRLVSIGHVSNALGTVNPIKRMTQLARDRGIPVMIDGAQAAPHFRIDVQDIGCDFYAISGHKMFGPTGIGLLYGRAERLEEMAPYQGGGDMIRTVAFDGTTFAPIPAKFEAGTPNIAGAVGLGAAIDYLAEVGGEGMIAHEADVLAYAHERITAVDGVRLIGTAHAKTGVVSFLMDGVHAHDVGTIVDQHGVAIRTGHHCAQPVMDFFGVEATARASFALYNTRSDVDALVRGLEDVREVFGQA